MILLAEFTMRERNTSFGDFLLIVTLYLKEREQYHAIGNYLDINVSKNRDECDNRFYFMTCQTLRRL